MYYKLQGWINIHPNHNIEKEDLVCPNCGSTHLHRKGYQKSLTNTYQRLHCQNCGKWSRTKISLKKNKSESAIPI